MFMSRNEIKFLGGHSSEVTPDPIPNSEVKLTSADGTAGEILWESRSPPRFRFETGKCLIPLPRFQFFFKLFASLSQNQNFSCAVSLAEECIRA